MEKSGKQAIIVDELPYQVGRRPGAEADQRADRREEDRGIADLRNESDKKGMRSVIELKRGEVPEIILNNLYKLTQMQETFGMNMVALVDNQPRVLNLKQFLDAFLRHRREVVTRRTVFDLRKARDRGHVLEGLAVALSNVDEVIALIKAAPTPAVAKEGLMARAWRSPLVQEMLARASADQYRPENLPKEFGLRTDGYRLSEPQAQKILEMQLQRLTGLEQDKILSEYKEVIATIEDLLDILAKPERVSAIIAEELAEIRREFADPRRSEIVVNGTDLQIEDLIASEDVVVTLSHAGYVKASRSTSTARRSAAGAASRPRPRRKTTSSRSCSSANTHDYVLCFSNKGKATGSRSTRCRRAAAPAAASRS
jgi:DNA gyrase subunit A